MPHENWEDSHYGTLGVNIDASRQEIRAARRMIRKICPVKAARSEEEAAFFRQVKAASKFLLNDERRKNYDSECDLIITKEPNILKWQRKANKCHKRREASEKRLESTASDGEDKQGRKKLRERKREIWAQHLMNYYECFEIPSLQRKLHLRALPANGHKHDLITRMLNHHGLKYGCELINEKKHTLKLVKQGK